MAPVLSFIGAWRTTQYANAQAEAQAATSEMDAKIMQQNADAEAQNRDNQLAESRRKYNLLEGQNRAQAGALGIFGGSALDVLADVSNTGLFEQKTIVQSTVAQQQNYLNQAASYKARASNLLASRQSPWVNASLAGIGSIVGSSSPMPGGTSGYDPAAGTEGMGDFGAAGEGAGAVAFA